MKKSVSKSKTSSKPGSSDQGSIIILSAPSGCGKTTIVDRLLKRHPEWIRSISATTRAIRPGEKDGEDYFFLSSDKFEQMKKKGEFLESAHVFGYSYGTPKEFVLGQCRQGKNVLMAIDVQGTKLAKKVLSTSVPLLTIFVLPPSIKVLRERLEGRKTDTPEEIEKRTEVAQKEIKEASFYDQTVVNQNLEQVVLEIEGLIEKFQKERGKKDNAVHIA